MHVECLKKIETGIPFHTTLSVNSCVNGCFLTWSIFHAHRVYLHTLGALKHFRNTFLRIHSLVSLYQWCWCNLQDKIVPLTLLANASSRTETIYLLINLKRPVTVACRWSSVCIMSELAVLQIHWALCVVSFFPSHISRNLPVVVFMWILTAVKSLPSGTFSLDN